MLLEAIEACEASPSYEEKRQFGLLMNDSGVCGGLSSGSEKG